MTDHPEARDDAEAVTATVAAAAKWRVGTCDTTRVGDEWEARLPVGAVPLSVERHGPGAGSYRVVYALRVR